MASQKSLQPLGGVAREVRKDQISSGTLDGGQNFHCHAAFVDPAALGGCLHHGEFATYIVGGQGDAKAVFDPADDVEVRQGRLDHDDVRTLAEIQGNLAQSL